MKVLCSSWLAKQPYVKTMHLRYATTSATKTGPIFKYLDRRGRNIGNNKRRKYLVLDPESPVNMKGNPIVTKPGEHGGMSKRLGAQHGANIYVFHHLITNQILYSLDARLKNLRALRQLPYNGKKSKPAALRKDHWHQLAVITLPNGSGDVGRSVYSKLRELKKLHELSFDKSLLIDKEKKWFPREEYELRQEEKEEDRLFWSIREKSDEARLTKKGGKTSPKRRLLMKKRRNILNNQKPNAVADMALVLKKLVNDADNIGLIGAASNIRVLIRWTNITDAYYAEEWSENVEHDNLTVVYNNRDKAKERPFNRLMKNYIAQKEGLTVKPDDPTVMKTTKGGVRRESRRDKARVIVAKRNKITISTAQSTKSEPRTKQQKEENIARHQLLVDSMKKACAEKKAAKRERHEALLAAHREVAATWHAVRQATSKSPKQLSQTIS